MSRFDCIRLKTILNRQYFDHHFLTVTRSGAWESVFTLLLTDRVPCALSQAEVKVFLRVVVRRLADQRHYGDPAAHSHDPKAGRPHDPRPGQHRP